MILHKLFLPQPHVAASLVLILLSAFFASAKTGHPPVVQTPPPTENIFSLSDFDPVGNGIADDGPALQRAFDALAEAGGGTLLIPAGSYKILTPVVKDFSAINDARVNIKGVPSTKMPAPVTASGEQLAAGLDLTSEIIPATGAQQIAITLSNLDQLTIEDVVFKGTETSMTDAYITLYFIDIDKVTVRHCEFYGISTFGIITELGGGNVIRALRSELSIELTVFLGCTANSGGYAPLVENMEWKRFSISNSIFIDYGITSFYGKTGLGAPLSWIGMEHAAPKTPESPRREVIVRDTFLDEGGWVGISVLPYRWAAPPPPIDLIYISGLKMNVCNMGMTGHLIYDTRNVLVENSHYGWSHNAYAAMDFNRVEHAILDNLTLIAHADRIRADSLTGRLTVINSVYNGIDSEAATTTVLETTPEEDPVQYVRMLFSTVLGRSPDPAAHSYWSDLLIRCGSNTDCLNEKRSALNKYLSNHPQETFALAGTVTADNGEPLSGAGISLLTGPDTLSVVTDSQGKFRFAGLPTSGIYTVAVDKRHYTFATPNQTFVHPASDLTVDFDARVNRHSIEGRIVGEDGHGISGVTLQLAQSSTTTATTDSDGFYSFSALEAGGSYTVVPSADNFVFGPETTTFHDLAADKVANFIGKLGPDLLMMDGSEFALAFDSVSFITQPFSLLNSFGLIKDGFIRVMVFAKNLEPVSGPSQVSVVAKDDNGQVHALEVEYFGEVPNQSWLKQINVKIPSSSLSGKCVELKVTVAGANSNDARLCLSSATSSSAATK